MIDITSIKEAVSSICEEYDVDRLFLFESYARNEAKEGSDVDLRVDRGSLTGVAYGGFYGDVQRALGLPTDILTMEQLKADFLHSKG